MIDPGHPFSIPYEQLIASLEESLRDGVEQPDREVFVFRSTVGAYELPRPVHAITRVTGLLGGRFTVFIPGQDYDFQSNRVTFRQGGGARRPDDGARLEVEYTYRERPSGLTDFNPGSVVGTLVRAVAREMKLLYEQMDQAYRRAFIDVATGAALDNVVALLGVTRRPALPATGRVTFFRKAAARDTVTLPAGIRLAEANGRLYETTEQGRIEAEPVEETVTPSGLTLRVSRRIAEVKVIWPEGLTPENGLEWVATGKKPFGEDERTVTLKAAPPPGRLGIRYVARSVQVAVRAVQPGLEGNAAAGVVVIMPTPPRGVDGVVNEEPITGGQVAEPDDLLRVRAKHALDRAGNATLDAIKFAVLEISGVDGVTVIDSTVDERVPPGEVRVRYSTAITDPAVLRVLQGRVAEVVNATRAAGIRARLEQIKSVRLSGTFFVIPDVVRSADAARAFKEAVVDAVKGLAIGAPLSVKRLGSLVFRVPGLADVAEPQLRYTRQDGEPTDVTDPLLIEPTEQIRPDVDNLQVRVLEGIAVKAVRDSGSDRLIDLQMSLEGQAKETAAPLKQLSLDVTVTVKAGLKHAPELPPERVATLTRRLTFTPVATLTLSPGDLTGYRPEDHDPAAGEVTITAAAYDGLGSAVQAISLPVSSS